MTAIPGGSALSGRAYQRPRMLLLVGASYQINLAIVLLILWVWVLPVADPGPPLPKPPPPDM